MRSQPNVQPAFRPRILALAIAGLLATPLLHAGNTNSVAPSTSTTSGGELTVPVTVPTAYGLEHSHPIAVSLDGSTTSGFKIDGSSGRTTFFVATGATAKELSTTYRLQDLGGTSSDGKSALYTVTGTGITNRGLLLVQDQGGASLQTTVITAPATVNGASYNSIQNGYLSSSGNAIAANLKHMPLGPVPASNDLAVVYFGPGATPIALNNDTDTTGKTLALAIADRNGGARVVGTDNASATGQSRAAYWDVSTGSTSATANIITPTAAFNNLSITSNQVSEATAISSNGEVIAGVLQGSTAGGTAFGSFAYRNGQDYALSVTGGEIAKGAIGGMSASGDVIGLNPNNKTARVFTFNGAGYTETDIGTVGTGSTLSTIQAVSADGSTVVGLSGTTNFRTATTTALRWTSATGSQSVATWLSSAGVSLPANTALVSASGVSRDGKVVVGVGMVNGSDEFHYLARVGAVSGLMNVEEFNSRLPQASQRIVALNDLLINMSLYGAHHRVLMDNGIAQGGKCGWVTGDIGGGRGANQQVGEVGFCGDLGNWRLGIGLGTANGRQDLDFSGRSKLNGQFLSAEANYGWAERSRILSATMIYGNWDASLKRGYQNGAATDFSTGSTRLDTLAFRTRFDWKDFAQLGSFGLSPYVSHTLTQTRLGGYTENGGAFPVRFAGRNITSNELRGGVSGKLALNQQTELRAVAEGVTQFGRREDKVNGEIIGLNAFSMSSGNSNKSWVRGGLEIDRRLSNSALLSASVNSSTSGRDVAYGGSVSLKMAF